MGPARRASTAVRLVVTQPAIPHARTCCGHPRLVAFNAAETWMAGTSPAMTLPSNRQIIVLPSRHLHRLAAQHGQRPRNARAGGARHDDVVDIAAFGGDERRQEPFLVFLGALGDLVGIA